MSRRIAVAFDNCSRRPVFSVCTKTSFRCVRLPAGATLYRKMKAYLMTEEQLQEHGYPRPNPEAAGRAVIYNQPEKKAVADRE